MDLSSLPQWLSPVWIAFYLFVGAAAWLYGNALTRKRHARDCREAERQWLTLRGSIFSCDRSPKNQPEVVVEVSTGPLRGKYRAPVSLSLASGCEIGQPLTCRIGRHPGDRVSDPMRCVIERML